MAAQDSVIVPPPSLAVPPAPSRSNPPTMAKTVFRCHYENCENVYKRKDHLQRHIDAKHNNIRFKCQVEGCEAEYTQKDKLSRHVVRVHGTASTNIIVPAPILPTASQSLIIPAAAESVPQFQTTVSATSSTATKTGRVTKKTASTRGAQTGRFKCEYEGCSRVYSRKDHLQRHIEGTHANVRHPCPVPGCSITYSRKDHLINHMASKHPNEPRPASASSSRASRSSSVTTNQYADVVCETCQQGTDDSTLLLCDACSKNGKHLTCFDPPLTDVPNGDWFCQSCIQSYNNFVAENLAQ